MTYDADFDAHGVHPEDEIIIHNFNNKCHGFTL